MAKPIRATPKLNIKESIEFVEKMIKFEKSKISKIDRETAEWIKENSKVLASG